MAHGTDIHLNVVDNNQIEVNAVFDTGEPMSEAQIIVYAADDPERAWHTGTADSNGTYLFPVDTTISGDWAMTIRTAGHGELLHFNVNNRGVISIGLNAGRPGWQTAVSALLVVGLLGGVAYFFNQPKSMKMAEARV